MKFIHLRYRFKDQISDINPQGIFNKGGVTVCYQKTPEHFTYSLAYCNLKDNFNRRLGREISSGRFNAGYAWIHPVEVGEDLSMLLEKHVLKRIETHLPESILLSHLG
jgi:hypothetical protein